MKRLYLEQFLTCEYHATVDALVGVLQAGLGGSALRVVDAVVDLDMMTHSPFWYHVHTTSPSKNCTYPTGDVACTPALPARGNGTLMALRASLGILRVLVEAVIVQGRAPGEMLSADPADVSHCGLPKEQSISALTHGKIQLTALETLGPIVKLGLRPQIHLLWHACTEIPM